MVTANMAKISISDLAFIARCDHAPDRSVALPPTNAVSVISSPQGEAARSPRSCQFKRGGIHNGVEARDESNTDGVSNESLSWPAGAGGCVGQRVRVSGWRESERR